MSPFSITVQNVPDRELGPLLTRLAEAGVVNPEITAVDAAGEVLIGGGAPAGGAPVDLPAAWHLVKEREGESYRWPKRTDEYAPYRVFMGMTREGAVQIALGTTVRTNAWGRERTYVVAFLTGGSPQDPLVEFVAADDFAETSELVAVIRGSDGARRMYGVGDALPPVYAERFRTGVYNERIIYRGVWNKVVVVARQDDVESMLNHALIQSRRRYRS